jgi:hypothetical protein
MFLVFAFVQVNDPDPVIWILVYGVMALFSIMAAFEFYIRKLLWVSLIAFGLYSIYYFPGVQEWLSQDHKEQLFDNLAKMEHLYIEESREFLGLAICNAVLVFYLIRSRKKGYSLYSGKGVFLESFYTICVEFNSIFLT